MLFALIFLWGFLVRPVAWGSVLCCTGWHAYWGLLWGSSEELPNSVLVGLGRSKASATPKWGIFHQALPVGPCSDVSWIFLCVFVCLTVTAIEGLIPVSQQCSGRLMWLSLSHEFSLTTYFSPPKIQFTSVVSPVLIQASRIQSQVTPVQLTSFQEPVVTSPILSMQKRKALR